MAVKKPFQWVAKVAAWFGSGGKLPSATVKAAADSVVAQTRADIGVLVTRLTSGEITVAELEPLMQQAIKRGIIANAALANGGYDNLTPKILERAEKQVLEQHDFLRNRVKVIQKNVGSTGQLRPRDAHDLISYSNKFRSVYENERVAAQKEIGHTMAKRVMAAVKHCDSCQAVADEGWMPIEDMPEIGSDDCGNNCHCVIITGFGDDD